MSGIWYVNLNLELPQNLWRLIREGSPNVQGLSESHHTKDVWSVSTRVWTLLHWRQVVFLADKMMFSLRHKFSASPMLFANINIFRRRPGAVAHPS